MEGEHAQELERIPEKKRLVVMLGARMYPGESGLIFPLTIPESKKPHESTVGRTSGGFARMRAVQSEYRKASRKGDLTVLVTGGQEPGVGSRADEAAKTLVSRYGLSPENVVSIGGRGSTLGNASATVEFIKTHPDTLGEIRDIEIVTNDYHMLRAWIMFSQGVLESTGGKLEVSQEDREKIHEHLDSGLAGEWNAHRTKETRDTVVRILEPYFAKSDIKVVPVVAEEVFDDAGHEGNIAQGKYATLLRNNAAMPEVLRSEYKGVMDLLEGRYKGKL